VSTLAVAVRLCSRHELYDNEESMNTQALHSPVASSTARKLLACGVAAGPIYVVVGLAQAFTREGFDLSRHALSQLSNGEYGWIQMANFFVTGVLVLAGALGVRRVLHPGRAGTWGAILLAGYGVGLIGAAFFSADPGRGFPPGAPMEGMGMSTHGLLHFVFGGVGFYSLIAACFVFARRFAASRERGWMGFSILTGTLFFIAFAAVASGNGSPAAMLGLGAAILLAWIWHASLTWSLLKAQPGA
jgi:hypothetical protein